MELTDFGERLAKLRTIKGVSAREMSLSLGHSENYINKIENGWSYPKMAAFFDICFYLGITQMEFFDEDNSYPPYANKMMANYKRLNESKQLRVADLVEDLLESK